jgi:hypothetical protein
MSTTFQIFVFGVTVLSQPDTSANIVYEGLPNSPVTLADHGKFFCLAYDGGWTDKNRIIYQGYD